MNIKIHHIGIVVEDIEKNIELFELLGFKKIGEKTEDLIQNNYLQMMIDSQKNKIELIKPINNKSSIKGSNLGIHHIAVETDDEEQLTKTIKQNKLRKIFFDNIPAPLFNNKNVSFCFLKNDILIEIVSK